MTPLRHSGLDPESSLLIGYGDSLITVDVIN